MRVDVGQDVAVRQHHALRHAGAAAREDDRGEVVGFRYFRSIDAQQQARGQQPGDRGDDDLLRLRRLSSARLRGRPCRGVPRSSPSIRKTRDVRIVLMPHCSIASAIDSRPAVKFRFTGTRAGERDRDVRERAADRRRQQQADHLFAAAVRANPARQQQRRRPACGRRSAPGRVESAIAEAAPVALRRRARTRACSASAGRRRCPSPRRRAPCIA